MVVTIGAPSCRSGLLPLSVAHQAVEIEGAAPAWTAFRARAYEELARHYERREKNVAMALECVRAARDLEDSDALRSRELRLRARAERV